MHFVILGDVLVINACPTPFCPTNHLSDHNAGVSTSVIRCLVFKSVETELSDLLS